jgi:hypothetical protein
MRPSRLAPIGVLTASTIIMSSAVPTGPALARSPFPGILAPVFGAVGHVLPHRHWHHRHYHHVASHPAEHRAAERRTAEHPAEQPAQTTTASAEQPNTAAGGQIAARSPLFWPQLADNVFDYVFWPSGNDDRFWAYGYNEIVEGALHPGSRESLRASASTRGRDDAQTTGSVANTPSACASQQGNESADSLIKHIESTVQPTEAQRSAMDNLRTAAQHAFDYFAKACPKTRPLTPTARLDAMEDRIWAARQALLIMRAPVDKFYATLTDEQKTRLNGPSAPSSPSGQTTARAAGCNESSIDLGRMLAGGHGRPDPKQRPALEALQKTSTGLSRLLASSCPATLPTTPLERLDTADRRLNSMLYAVVTLRAPLDAFSSAQQPPRVSGLRR